MRTTAMRAALLAVVMFGLAAATWPTANAADSHAQITGSGSSWSANAVNQWVADVTSTGLQVVFTSSGSAQGRKDFTNDTTDFGVSDIGYQGVDSVTGDSDSNCQNPKDATTCRGFAYLPIVAGGTSFPYNIKVAGQQLRNLRLSGQTLAKIFTNQITNWNDPAITADNNGRVLPSLTIVPIVHSEGSGSTAQFTLYLNQQYPSIWRPFFGQAGSTEYFPRQGGAVAQSGSDGVINFLTSAAANGAIGYDEYSYALSKNFPVVKVENAAGYFTLPTQYNVAVALQKAQINTDKSSPNYLLQNLNQVYTYNDQRTYPLSSYSYMLIPTTANDQRMTTPKRQNLADFLYYSICQGQAEMGPIGYSPLPINLVQASFDQTAKLKVADPNVDLKSRNISTCNNPTFIPGQPKKNHLAVIAPQPPPCDYKAAGPCADGGNSGTGPTPTSSGTSAPIPGKSTGTGSNGGSGSGGTGGGGSGSGTSGSGTSGGTSSGAGGGSNAGTSGGAINPDTGQAVGNIAGGGAAVVTGTVTEVSAYRASSLTSTLAPVVAIELLLLLGLPPTIYFLWIKRRRSHA